MKINNKGFKYVCLILLLISTSIFGATLEESIYGNTYERIKQSTISNNDKKIYADNFYESDKFDNELLQNILDRMYVATSSKEMYGEQSKIDARRELDDFKDMKFFIKNDLNNNIYTNTKYKTNDEFRKNQKDYCNLEVDFNDSGDTYTKIIDNKRISVKTNRHLFWGIPKDNLTISISLPEKPNESYDTFGFSSYYYEFEHYKELSISLFKGLMVSGISAIISFIAYLINKKELINKESLILRVYKKMPLEIYILMFCISGFLAIINVQYIISIILKLIFLTGVFLWAECFKKLDKKTSLLKSSIIYIILKFFVNVISNIIKYQKKLPLMRKLILINIITITISGMVLLFLYTTWYWQEPLIILMAIMIILATNLFVATGYIINKLGYIDAIMDGTKKIKNGDIHHKIEIKGDDALSIFAQNINNLSDGLDNAIEEKFKSERMKTELITNVSHDLKTPLTSIINYVDLIKKEENIQPEYLKDYVNVLDNKSRRLKSLIEDLFEASKASSGNIELNIEKLDLNQLLRQSIGETEEKLASSHLDLKVNIPKEAVYINCDGRRMYRVFENLLTNIAKYSLNNTRVYIDMKLANDKVYLSMKNISAYELNFEACEIIERFKRGDLARNTEGSGLGLAIARDLVELQDGKFDIQIDGDLFKVELIFNQI
ncbi:MAG: sensor histidine kinase [Paraclostridium sp.]|uniref:sensor histidine kinase n=1 Tax=Paraclostridium sp. TaxID=2023273 RepID=UPI003F318415